ncbi:FecCD family ABC transporter permease [Streptomyces sp. LE64]|uniref:FecCD family ABC transporter permease n=1 Tax=Streptomyces sp. LE64 TaxID=3448653 RepID=UPI0040414E9E
MTTTARPPVRRAGALRLASCLVAAALLLVAATAASVMFGSMHTGVGDVLDVLSGDAGEHVTTVVESRYPRTLLGLLVGVCLAVCGTLMQGITRNPLAEPGLLGVNTGAAAGVVTATAFLGATGAASAMWWALPGALVAGVLVHAIGFSGPSASPVRLVLAGAVLTAVLMAYVQAITLSRPQTFDDYRYWVVGALGGRDYEVLWTVLPFAGVGLLVAVLVAPGLNALALGDESATSLGANPALTRAFGWGAAVLLAAAATAAAGPIAFVGLAVPHVVRGLVGADHRGQIALAVLVGPTLLLVADVVGRVLLRPQELMVGVVTAFVGAPALLVTLRRTRHAL